MVRTIWKVGILVFLVGGAMSSLKPPPKELTPEEREANELRSRKFAAVEYAKSIIPKKMRDPASAVFGTVNAYTDRKFKGKPVTVACGSVNGKNGFGGYTGMNQFVLIAETGTLVFDSAGDNGVFVELWNSLCAGKHT